MNLLKRRIPISDAVTHPIQPGSCIRLGEKAKEHKDRVRLMGKAAGTRSLSVPGPMTRDNPHVTMVTVQSLPLRRNGHFREVRFG